MDIAYKSESKSLGVYQNIYETKYSRNVTKLKTEQVCYVIKSLNKVMSLHATRSIYFANFHAPPWYSLRICEVLAVKAL